MFGLAHGSHPFCQWSLSSIYLQKQDALQTNNIMLVEAMTHLFVHLNVEPVGHLIVLDGKKRHTDSSLSLASNTF